LEGYDQPNADLYLQGALNSPQEDYEYYKLGEKVFPTIRNLERPEDGGYPGRDKYSWGCLIHPDEIRKIMAFGNGKLMTSSGEQFQDHQLKNWIDLTVQSFSDQIQWDIYPRLWRHRPTQSIQDRLIEPFAEWEDTYDFNGTENLNFTVKLRRKPICRLHKWDIFFPVTGQRMIDLRERAIIKSGAGILQAVFVKVPYTNTSPVPTGIVAWRSMIGATAMPGAYQVDYTSGYDHANRVPAELKEQILKLFTISLMSSFGDGIIGGMANYSVSTGVLSESVGTTMSATSAYYGARILQLTNELKEWWKSSRLKYQGVGFRAL
jgi:hypothetical protein